MKRFLSVFLLLLLFAGRLFAYTPSETTQISVLICSPGEELYSRFGHAAIRLRDTVQNVDGVFDYGTFVAESVPSFVWNFLTGEMYYLLDANGFRSTVWFYERENRSITEYPLLLTSEEKITIGNRLLVNLQPENQAYLYNFFEDNCATRLRDIFSEEIPNLAWNESYKQQTWRQTVIEAIGTTSWVSFGIHLGLGVPADTLASEWQMMYLPAVLGQTCISATRADGTKVCGSPELITRLDDSHNATSIYNVDSDDTLAKSKKGEPWWNNSALILWVVALLFAIQTIREIVTKKRCVWCDVTFFFVMGLLGFVIWFLSFFSVHSLVFPNWNALWLNPLHLLFAILYMVPKWRKYTQWYFCVAADMALLSVLISLIVGQFIPPASWPLLLMFVMRAIPVVLNFYISSCDFAEGKRKKTIGV